MTFHVTRRKMNIYADKPKDHYWQEEIVADEYEFEGYFVVFRQREGDFSTKVISINKDFVVDIVPGEE